MPWEGMARDRAPRPAVTLEIFNEGRPVEEEELLLARDNFGRAVEGGSFGWGEAEVAPGS
jgi:hypothetical protein